MRQDLVLAQPSLELNGTRHLLQLCRDRSRAARLQQSRQLHGDGRTARNDPAMPDELPGGTGDCQRIDPGMIVEPLVLIGDQKRKELRIDFIQRHGKTPAAFGIGKGTQQFSVTVDNFDAQIPRVHNRRRKRLIERNQRNP